MYFSGRWWIAEDLNAAMDDPKHTRLLGNFFATLVKQHYVEKRRHPHDRLRVQFAVTGKCMIPHGIRLSELDAKQ